MKCKQHLKREIDVNLSLPKDFQWKLFRALLQDLRCLETETPNPSLPSFEHTEWAKFAHSMLRNRRFDQISELGSLNGPPCMLGELKTTEDSYEFFVRYQVGSFLKKYPSGGESAREKAFAIFLEMEHHCKLFNEENYRALLSLNDTHPFFYGMVGEIQQDIACLIGEYPNLNSVYYHAKHGPGSAVGDLYSKGRVTPFFKWSNLPYTVTSGAYDHAKAVIESDPRWIGALDDWYRQRTNNLYGPIDLNQFWSAILKVVDQSEITTVPKTFDVERTIAIEAALNVFLQLGVDQVIRRRLKSRWGYNLDDQGVNKGLAKKASIDDDYATLDLKGASETVTLKICDIFLPPAWYDLLLELRSPVGVLGKGGPLVEFQKISSMGNGYTFALESLIFGAIVRYVARKFKVKYKDTSIYGDDIIVPSSIGASVIEHLNLCGFLVNEDKTFLQGPFRESCGSDYFLGHFVRPLFLKIVPKTVLDLFYLHNISWVLEENLPWFWDVHFSHFRSLIMKYIPKTIRNVFYGPPSESLDTYLFSTRSLPRNHFGQRFSFRIHPSPITYRRRYKDYFFIKLMANLKGHGGDKNYSNRTKPNSGNSFDIVKRDRVLYQKARVTVW